jgi:hypothetical protein
LGPLLAQDIGVSARAELAARKAQWAAELAAQIDNQQSPGLNA